MRRLLINLLLLGALTVGAPAPAANLAELSLDDQWLALLHYKRRGGATGPTFVDDPDFFLSDRGHFDAEAELSATLKALETDPATRCRYPARALWATNQGLIAPELADTSACDDYTAWRERVNARYVVLVFAASYLNSPSSMYGHTFLRFDPADIEDNSTLLSYALNFGANVDDSDNSIIYAWKGLAGGYPGGFAAARYLDKAREYTRLENRDLWEYRLNLTADEVNMMLAHVWELDRVNFDYYFLSENCSFRLLELIDVARPGMQLAANFGIHAIPSDTVRVVDEQDLVADVYYRASSQTRLQASIDGLSRADQATARSLADDLAVKETPAFTSRPDTTQAAIVQVAYGYLRYANEKGERDPEIASRSYQLLRQLSELPAPPDRQPVTPLRPDRGHQTTMLAVSAGAEDGQGIADLEWRGAYHDLVDPSPGYPRGMSLNMGRIALRARNNDGLQLQLLEILEINSLAPRDKFFRPLSWQVSTGFDRQWTDGRDKLVPQVNAGVGGTWGLLKGSGYLLGRSRLEYNSRFDQELDIAGGALAGWLFQGEVFSTRLEGEQLWFTDGVDRSLVRVEQGWTLSDNLALRAWFKRTINDSEGISEAGLSVRTYF